MIIVTLLGTNIRNNSISLSPKGVLPQPATVSIVPTGGYLSRPGKHTGWTVSIIERTSVITS